MRLLIILNGFPFLILLFISQLLQTEHVKEVLGYGKLAIYLVYCKN